MFDLELLRFFAAWAAPEKPGAMADTNARGSTAGATRNAAVRNGIRNLCDMNFLPGVGSCTGPTPHHSIDLNIQPTMAQRAAKARVFAVRSNAHELEFPLARPAARRLERDLRHAAFVDADRRQSAAGVHAARQSLVERHLPRQFARPGRAAKPLRRPHLRRRVRLHRP